jgi:hypothetical protein
MMRRALSRIKQWRLVLLTHQDYHRRLNRCSEVEAVLWSVASGKRGPLTPEECRQLAIKLGIPTTKGQS